MNEGLDKTNGLSHDDDDTFLQATSKHLKALIHIEATWTLFRRIHSAVGKDRMQGVSMVIAPDHQGVWSERHEPEEIFKALIAEYKAKYHQTETTPPMTYPVVNYLGFLGDSPNCLDVLNGTLPSIPNIHPYSQRLLTKLQRIDEYQDIPVGISKQDYQEGWKKAKETKS